MSDSPAPASPLRPLAPRPLAPLPRATLRLQLGPGFGFAQVQGLLAYFATLGVSHLYLSPFLKARAGSTHGYDIVDHNAFNPEIGDADSFERLVAAAHSAGLGLILDFVPNHMGIGGADNPWWLSVLEWGTASLFAEFFDIDWNASARYLKGKVLLPFLGDHYGHVLERGELVLRFAPEEGSFSVWYHEHRFPIALTDYAQLLRRSGADLAEPDDSLRWLIDGFARMTRRRRSPARQAALLREAAELKAGLAALAHREPLVLAAIERTVAATNGTPGTPASFAALHRLLERQAYRIAYWRVASDEINYRRFFDINELAGLCVENEAPFEASHRLVLRLLAEGKLQGLRIDHIDGLYDPAAYCRRLQRHAAYLTENGARGLPAPADQSPMTAGPDQPLYLLVEKILGKHERLPEDWPVAGTTGYEVLNLINGLFVDPTAERRLTATYERFTGRHEPFEEVVYSAKQQILTENLASELNVLAAELQRLAQRNWATRDFTLNSLRAALAEVIARFPVYRTYVSEQGVAERDRHYLNWAVGRARRAASLADPSLFDFIYATLAGEFTADATHAHHRRDVLHAAMKAQQLTGPVMAKAFEDTALYRYNRLISLNAVGSEPTRFGTSLSAFHHLSREQHQPYGLVTTMTHDAKRGEDARQRINAISEAPSTWARSLARWSRLNKAKRRLVEERPTPCRNDEYLFYQALLGAWPFDLTLADRPRLDALTARLATYMIKAVREAKQHSSWSRPNLEYETATEHFVRSVLDSARGSTFLAEFEAYQRTLAPAAAINGLAQTVLRLTLPGVPDCYQGCELWNFDLVDPDNRRAVDYAPRQTALEAMQGGELGPDELLAAWPDGRIKLYLIWRLLTLRRELPTLFSLGDYYPLEASGPQAERVVAFLRRNGEDAVLVAVPRLVLPLLADDGPLLPCRERWQETQLHFPANMAGALLTSVLDESVVRLSATATLDVADLFTRLPVSAGRIRAAA